MIFFYDASCTSLEMVFKNLSMRELYHQENFQAILARFLFRFPGLFAFYLPLEKDEGIYCGSWANISAMSRIFIHQGFLAR